MKRLVLFTERNYLPITAFVSVLFLALNHGDQSMQGIVRYYVDYAQIIRSGFNPPPGSTTLPTFPMWGYGWMLVVFKTKLIVLFVQQILALVAVAVGVRIAERDSRLPRASVPALKVALVFSIPWYALHSVFWPYSIAASVLVISISLLAAAGLQRISRGVIASAICFGLLLHFRSDFILFPLLLILALVVFSEARLPAARTAFLWAGVSVLVLAPWSVYTKRATGHMLLTSTNSGHVLFLGLGMLPGNRWGITPDDGDPQLRRVVVNALGPGGSALTYAGNKVVMRETANLIAAHPLEYARKVAYSAAITVIRGFHPGSFIDTPRCEPRCYEVYVRQRSDLMHFRTATDATLLNPVRTVLELCASIFSRLLLVACVCALPFAGYVAWKRGSLLLGLSVLCAFYQSAISAFTYSLPGYTSNVYYFHLVNLVVVFAWLRERKSDPHGVKFRPGGSPP